jgi:hypothetical protein
VDGPAVGRGTRRAKPRFADLTGRIRELAERYATPLPKLTADVEALAALVNGHLKKMGASWK